MELALATDEQEREKTLDLNVGFSEGEWELIVKYNGSLDEARQLGAQVVELRNGFAILTVKESFVESVTDLPQIEFVEKPKRLSFAVLEGRRVSCINAVQGTDLGLTGQGVLLGIVDSGIDYTLADFRREDGSTRILRLWDQTAIGEDATFGRVYTEEEINEALAARTYEERQELVMQMDTGGHGTAVAGIAAGNGRGAGREAAAYRGVAYEADLLVVKLGTPRPNSFPRTTQLMMAMDVLVTESLRLGRPMVVNVSFGHSYGPHDGTVLLDTYLNALLLEGRFSFVVGAGNEGNTRGHDRLMLKGGEEQSVELAVGRYEPTLNIQIWKNFVDVFELRLEAPSGEIAVINAGMQPGRLRFGNTEVLVYYGEPSPFRGSQEIYLDFVTTQGYVESGVWKLLFTPKRIREGQVDLWLPGGGVLGAGTGFIRSDPETTLTIPSTAFGVITVAAYDGARGTYADFSGRGFLRQGYGEKPTIAAPGVNIQTTAVGGGYISVTGTSFATPFVSGCAALLMEWGIIRGNDPYLYGEKLKAYLARGAQEVSGISEYPSPLVGWGALCLADSLYR